LFPCRKIPPGVYLVGSPWFLVGTFRGGVAHYNGQGWATVQFAKHHIIMLLEYPLFRPSLQQLWSRDSSVDTVTGYEPDDRGLGV
jgi:hypothetical protein